MRRILGTSAAGFAALLLLLAAACGGNKSGNTSSSSDNGTGDGAAANAPAENVGADSAVLNAVEALGRSARGFQDEVESLRGEMTMDMSAAGMSFGMTGDFAFKAPDQMHMQMEFTGGDGELVDLGAFGSYEVLLIGGKLYMYVPFFGGWTVATLEELGVDAQQYQEMLNDHSPFDYADLVESFGGAARVDDLGEEEIDGETYQRFRIESDLASLMGALSGAFGEELSGDGILPTEGLSGAITADIWLERETLLPYKLTARGTFTGSGAPGEPPIGEMLFNMTIIVAEYNGDVTLPEPPADARPLSEVSGEMFAE